MIKRCNEEATNQKQDENDKTKHSGKNVLVTL